MGDIEETMLDRLRNIVVRPPQPQNYICDEIITIHHGDDYAKLGVRIPLDEGQTVEVVVESMCRKRFGNGELHKLSDNEYRWGKSVKQGEGDE